jgi:hypothetical protein
VSQTGTLHLHPYNSLLRPELSMRLLGKALTFDDVLLVPSYSSVLPRDTDLATSLSRNIRLNLPLVSAAMDHRHRGASRDRARAGRRDRHRPQEPHPEAAGRGSRARQALRIRRAARSDHCLA